jgi:hypothetical protein
VTSSSPFPKLSQLWRFVRLSGTGFATAALAGLAHVGWADRTAIAVAAVGAVEASYRQVFPSGKLSGRLAALLAAYRQISAAAKTAPVAAAAPVANVASPVPAGGERPAGATVAHAAPPAVG